MADWTAIRRLARGRREEVVGSSGRRVVGKDPATDHRPRTTDDRLQHADGLIAAALARAGLQAVAVPANDSLLAGAQALLDRELMTIWHDVGLPQTTTQFNLAHELAHWWLHDESGGCQAEDMTPDSLSDPLPFGQDYVSGYSPAQRREVEANVFAAEFLLPSPLLRSAFLAGRTSDEITAAVGLSESAVLGQMAEALLAAPETTDDGRQTTDEGDGAVVGGTSSVVDLDASQQAAAEVERGPVLIAAGPGTGKTRTLVARVLFLLDRGVAPENILALTFSNKAANEMRERLAAVVPEAARRLWIGTFHAFGLELLRRYGTRIGLPSRPALLDPLDAIALLERHLARLDLREYEYLHNPIFPFRDILSAISRAKDELATPEQYAALAGDIESAAEDDKARVEAARAREVAGVYRAWQAILAEEGTLDFGDLISRAVELLERCPDVRDEVRAQYPQILVDEYQDINRASAVLVKQVAGDGAGLWAVGDLRQAIYRFRGASPANLSAFERDYPQGRRLSLAVNYRSRPPLVQLFAAAAGKMGVEEEADWKARREGAENAIVVAEAEDESAQAEGIADSIRRHVAQGIPLNEQAILYRTNAQATTLAEMLEARGIPVLYLGDLFERPEIKDMLSLLSLAGDRRGLGLLRVGRFPEYDVPQAEILSAIREVPTGNPSLSAAGLQRIETHLAPLRYRGDAGAFLARYLFGPADYLRRLIRNGDSGSRQQRMALYQLLQLARRHARSLDADESHPHGAFLEHVRRLIATGEDTRVRLPAGEEIDAVRLLTIHSSKGLEFPVVYVPNMTKDLFPSRKPGALVKLPAGLAPPTDDSEEDAYLFFVALSRARDHLVLSRPKMVNGKPREASPLLGPIQEALDACGAARVEWTTDHGPQTTDDAPSDGGRGDAGTQGHGDEYSVSEVEQYQRCPRQYYYARVLELPAGAEDSAYGAFQKCVWSVIRRIREERDGGREFPIEAAGERLRDVWRTDGPPTAHPHEPVLRARAEEIVARACEHAAGQERETKSETEIVAELENGRIRIKLDGAVETEDGRIVVERYRTGKPGSDDHTSPRLALYRRAAKTAHGDKKPVEVRLRYLTTGEIKTAPEQPRWEPNRIAKYEEALRGIQAGEFEARPSQDQCPRCPFFFICPV